VIIPLLAALALVITTAKLGGWLSSYLKQPVVLGKLLVGIALGPSVLNVFALEYFDKAHVLDALREFGELGVIFLMFVAGLEVHLSDFVKAGKPAVLAGVLGVIVPIILGALATIPFGYDFNQAIFLGIVTAATSVSISAQTLMEMGRLRSREGLTLLGAAVVDDVLAIAVLSAFLAIALGGSGGALELVWILLRMAIFLVGAFLVGTWLLPRLARWVEDQRLPISEPMLSLVVVSILLFAWASEVVGGVAAITGAFIAGVALASSPLKDKIERGVHAMAYSFFVPVFLVSIGLTANARALSVGDIGFIAVVSIVAILSKLIGAGTGARLGGMSGREALRVGIGMISRGEVGLIVASAGVSAGIVSSAGFTVIVLMVLITTLVTPPLLRQAFRGKEV
jgi:Kef-type K+ transport system membrane component KefB